MDIMEEFLLQVGMNVLAEYETIECEADYSDFVVVDGEEGDYGTIKYFSGEYKHIATKTVLGGDNEYVEFTKYGKRILGKKAKEILKNNIFNMNTIVDQ